MCVIYIYAENEIGGPSSNAGLLCCMHFLTNVFENAFLLSSSYQQKTKHGSTVTGGNQFERKKTRSSGYVANSSID